MNPDKRRKLESLGWKVGDTSEYLQLTTEEAYHVELRLRLRSALKRERKRRRLTQSSIAERIGSSQSRIAKAEAGDPSVSTDLMLKAFFATGATYSDLVSVITA